MSEISQEKLDWLKSIGATNYDPPLKISWMIDDFNESYSNEYISKTPLKKLKALHESDHKSYLRELQGE